jgi:DNA repair photolyase
VTNAPREVTCKTACTKLHSDYLPYCWDLNVYRGCAHSCRYCFALYSHQFMDSADYFHDIFVKTNIVEALARQLASPSWQGEVINLGGVTDSYQPAEAEYRLMPDILRLLIKHKNPVMISTKSDLLLRDFDLFAELSRLTYVSIAATVTTVDESLRCLLEPAAAPSARRLAMLREFSAATTAQVGVHLMPIIPYLTDSEASLDQLLAAAAAHRVHYVIPALLNLKGATRRQFLSFIAARFPHHYDNLSALYCSAFAPRAYAAPLYAMLRRLLARHGLSATCQAYRRPSPPTLFD